MIISHVRHLDYDVEGPSYLNVTQRVGGGGTYSAIQSVTLVLQMSVGLCTDMDNMDEKVV